MKILLLEDDVVLCDVLEEFLSQHYEVHSTYSADEAEEMAAGERFDLFIFDINVLGSMDGIVLLRRLRSFSDNTPAIIITAYDDIEHLKSAFGSGANDFVRKPFALDELALRIDNIKKLFKLEEAVRIDSRTLFYPQMHEIHRGDEKFMLSQKDSEILHYLLSNAHRTVSAQELMQNLWDYDAMPTEATLRSHIRTIRHILGKECIKTIRGIGYRWML